MQLFLNLVIPYCKSYFSFFCLLLVYFHLLLSYFIQFFFPCPLSVAYCSYNSIILRASVPQQDLWDWRAGSCKLWGPLIGPFSWVLSSGQSSSHQLWIFLSSSFFSTSFLASPPAQSSLSLNTFLTVATPADPWIFPHMAGWKDIFAWLFAITCQLPLIMGTVLMCAHCTTKIHILCSEAQRKLMHDVVREPLVGWWQGSWGTWPSATSLTLAQINSTNVAFVSSAFEPGSIHSDAVGTLWR